MFNPAIFLCWNRLTNELTAQPAWSEPGHPECSFCQIA